MHGSQGAPRFSISWDIVLAGAGLSLAPQQSAAGATVRGTWLVSGALLEGWGDGGTGLVMALYRNGGRRHASPTASIRAAAPLRCWHLGHRTRPRRSADRARPGPAAVASPVRS